LTTALISIAFVFGWLSALALAGGFLLHPFRNPYVVYVMPMAGIAAQAIGVAALYLVAGLPFWVSAASTFVCGTVATLTSHWLVPRPLGMYRNLFIVLFCASTVLTPISIGPTLTSGSPTMAMIGTDQFNYAQTADWLLAAPKFAVEVGRRRSRGCPIVWKLKGSRA
jgi:hypothetical protein